MISESESSNDRAVQLLFDLIALYAVLPLLFALVNWGLLFLYVFPFLIPFFSRWTHFLVVPATVSAIAYGLFLYRSKMRGWRRRLSVNLLIFVTFLASAEIYKDALILIAAVRTPHDCLHIHTFAGAVHRMGEYAPAHAQMMIGSTPYFWSYSELKFVEGRPRPWYNCSSPFFAF